MVWSSSITITGKACIWLLCPWKKRQRETGAGEKPSAGLLFGEITFRPSNGRKNPFILFSLSPFLSFTHNQFGMTLIRWYTLLLNISLFQKSKSLSTRSSNSPLRSWWKRCNGKTLSRGMARFLNVLAWVKGMVGLTCRRDGHRLVEWTWQDRVLADGWDDVALGGGQTVGC